MTDDLFGGTAASPALPTGMTINTFGGDTKSLTAEIVAAYVAHNAVPQAELAGFIQSVHSTVKGLDANGAPAAPAPAPARHEPAVPVKKSVFPDRILSLIDGKPYKTLKRHLATNGLTPAEYRERYGLGADYPMVCAAYSKTRADLAKQAGLGTKTRAAA